MSQAIFKFTLLSCCLDRIKLIYIVLLGLIVPVAMKLVSYLNGASDSQTFEMLTGSVGVAFIMIGLCLGLAGSGASSQSGRGAEYLPLVLTRPITRSEYVFTKWLTFSLIGGSLAAFQNLLVGLLGLAFGDGFTPYVVAMTMLERMLDASLIAAALILVLIARHWLFQIASVLFFYIWMMAQTMPPVSISNGGASAADQAAIEGTRLMLIFSRIMGDMILPTINLYDALNSPFFPWLRVLAYLSAITLYLAIAIGFMNRKEFFYGTTS